MTREEAIKGLKVLRRDFSGYKPNEEMFDIAIQALEKENIYDDGEHYVTISKALYDKLNIDYEALSQEPNGYVNIAKDLIDDEEDSIFYQEPCDDAVSRLDKIRQIIAIPNSVIQEDVMKYRMICEVMNDDKSVS